MEAVFYNLRVNGEVLTVTDGYVAESLLTVLRDRLGLMGTKGACEQGECGSCSVIVDEALVCSCLVLAPSVADADIVTIEGLGPPSTPGSPRLPTDVQQAFIDRGAVQCGFCTPGLIVAVHDLLAANPQPTSLEMKEALSGNICRCTGYGRILDAVEAVIAIRGRAE